MIPAELGCFFQERHLPAFSKARGSGLGDRSIAWRLWGSVRVAGPALGPRDMTGSSHGHWRLLSPGRQQCLASHSGLVNLNVNLVTKLITDTPSPAHVACPLGSALRRLTKHLWSPCLVVFSCWLGPSRHGRTRLVARLLVGAGGWCPCSKKP